MVTKTILYREDIKKILANYFKVKESDVYVHLYMTCAGYGMDEHEVPEIEIEINKNQILKLQ